MFLIVLVNLEYFGKSVRFSLTAKLVVINVSNSSI